MGDGSTEATTRATEILRAATGRGPRLVAVGSGKGGVGRSVVAANVATALADSGQRVIAVDTDLGSANLHTLLGVEHPREGLSDFVARREEDLRKLAIETPVANLRLVAGTGGHLDDAQPDNARRVRLIRDLRQLDADWVVLDLGAGVHPATLDYFLVADDALLILSPEPTCIESAYAFLRAAFYRRLWQSMVSQNLRDLVTDAMDPRNERGIQNPLDLLREVEAADPAEGARFLRTVDEFRPKIVINSARSADDIRLGFSVVTVCQRYFGANFKYLGYINYDEAVRRSVIAKVPLVHFAKEADAANYLTRIARKISEPPPAVSLGRHR